MVDVEKINEEVIMEKIEKDEGVERIKEVYKDVKI